MAAPVENMNQAVPPKKGKRILARVCLWGGLLAVLLVAAAGQLKPGRTECKNACINNLRQIDGAKEQYALEHKISPGTVVTAAQVGEYLKGGVVPPCPAEGKYSIGAIGEPPTCNFLGNAHKLAL
jgi:hypothetical protein